MCAPVASVAMRFVIVNTPYRVSLRPNLNQRPLRNMPCVACLSGDGGEDQPGQRGGGERDGERILSLHARAAHGGPAEVVKGRHGGSVKHDVVQGGSSLSLFCKR